MMSPLIFAVLLGCAVAAPDGGYRAPRPSPGSGYRSQPINCPEGQAPDGTGTCVDAEIEQNVFVFDGPAIEPVFQPAPYVPRPKIENNIVYVRTPDQPDSQDPIVVPPPQQRYLIYVVTKAGEQEQKIIQVPAGDNQPPGVFYVNYRDGDNPQLGNGQTLQEILARQGQPGQVVNSGSGSFGGSSGFGSGGSGSFGGSSGFGSGGSGSFVTGGASGSGGYVTGGSSTSVGQGGAGGYY